MPLNIDMSRALRSRAELTALVESIVQAPPTEQETDYVEWKSTLDLRATAKDRFAAGKHLLGMGNRHPDRAARTFDGCGYLVIGAEPQSLHGVTAEDASNLENWVGAFVGSDGPQWGLSYVATQAKDILVITVEAPRWGDSIFTLAKSYGSFHVGAIFTRRTGQTAEADQAEVRMLEERAKRRPIALDVVLEHPAPLKTYITGDTDRTDWISAENHRLARPFQERRRAPMGLTASVLREDYRDEGEYVTQVNDYLSRDAGDLWQALVCTAPEMWRHLRLISPPSCEHRRRCRPGSSRRSADRGGRGRCCRSAGRS